MLLSDELVVPCRNTWTQAALESSNKPVMKCTGPSQVVCTSELLGEHHTESHKCVENYHLYVCENEQRHNLSKHRQDKVCCEGLKDD